MVVSTYSRWILYPLYLRTIIELRLNGIVPSILFYNTMEKNGRALKFAFMEGQETIDIYGLRWNLVIECYFFFFLHSHRRKLLFTSDAHFEKSINISRQYGESRKCSNYTLSRNIILKYNRTLMFNLTIDVQSMSLPEKLIKLPDDLLPFFRRQGVFTKTRIIV